MLLSIPFLTIPSRFFLGDERRSKRKLKRNLIRFARDGNRDEGKMLFCWDTFGDSETSAGEAETSALWIQLKCQKMLALRSHLLYFLLHPLFILAPSPFFRKKTQLFKSLFFIHFQWQKVRYINFISKNCCKTFKET